MTTDKRAAAIAALIVRDVAEIPDRCSPDDQPEMMLVTSGELTDIVMRRLAALEADDGRALRDTALSITGAIGGTRREDWDDTVPVPTGKLFRLRDLLAASEQPAPLCSECGDPMPVPLAHCCEKPEQPAPEPAARRCGHRSPGECTIACGAPDTRRLHEKFTVRRNDGRDAPGQKHHGCDYFVLDLTHDEGAMPALRAYADAVAATRPQLAADLRQRFGWTAPEPATWKPIDTAPEGCQFLAWVPGKGAVVMQRHMGWLDDEHVDPLPTHWMPLPKPEPAAPKCNTCDDTGTVEKVDWPGEHANRYQEACQDCRPIDAASMRRAKEPAAPHADDEARIAEILRKHAKGWTENDRLLIDDALLLATDTIRDLAAGKAKAEAELAAVDAAIADRGVPERDCSLPLPERVSNIISELKNWRHEAGTAQVEVERLRGRDAEPFDWDAAPSVQEWIDENLPEREPRAGSKMIELHPDEVIADRGESRRVAGWLKDLMAENADLRAKLAEAEKQRDAIVRDRDWWEKQYGTVAAAVIAASGLDESHGWDAALDSMKRRHAAVLAQRDAALADHTALARQELLSLACEFPVAWTLKGAQVIERISARIAALRAAKPEPAAEPVPAAADAKRNTDDEVLRDMLCEALPVQLHDVVHCLRVLCRRALEVRKRPDADAKPGDEVLRKVWDALRNTPHASVSLEQQKWCIAVERVVCELVERALEVRP